MACRDGAGDLRAPGAPSLNPFIRDFTAIALIAGALWGVAALLAMAFGARARLGDAVLAVVAFAVVALVGAPLDLFVVALVEVLLEAGDLVEAGPLLETDFADVDEDGLRAVVDARAGFAELALRVLFRGSTLPARLLLAGAERLFVPVLLLRVDRLPDAIAGDPEALTKRGIIQMETRVGSPASAVRH